MKEYIEREAAENIFWEEQQELLKWKRYYQFEKDEKEEYNRLESYQDKIKTIPAANVAEVRHGEWINHNTYVECSLCGAMPYNPSTYCPECGAKMDGKEDE